MQLIDDYAYAVAEQQNQYDNEDLEGGKSSNRLPRGRDEIRQELRDTRAQR